MAKISGLFFKFLGVPSRVIQLFKHVVCEVYWDNKWRLFDADAFKNEQLPLLPDGTWPSLEDLKKPNDLR